MKKLLFVIPLFLIIAQSCSSTLKLKPRDRIVIETYFDYSEYAKEGFLISPDPYTGDFEACGEIKINIIPGTKLVTKEDKFNPRMNAYEKNEYLSEEDISGQELLKIIVDKAKSKGADALTNFKANVIYDNYYNSTIQEFVEYFSHYELSGFAIKRK